jgi:hypothetical protein
LLSELLALGQLFAAGPADLGLALLQLREHVLDFLVVLSKDREHVRHLSSLRQARAVELPIRSGINQMN